MEHFDTELFSLFLFCEISLTNRITDNGHLKIERSMKAITQRKVCSLMCNKRFRCYSALCFLNSLWRSSNSDCRTIFTNAGEFLRSHISRTTIAGRPMVSTRWGSCPCSLSHFVEFADFTHVLPWAYQTSRVLRVHPILQLLIFMRIFERQDILAIKT